MIKLRGYKAQAGDYFSFSAFFEQNVVNEWKASPEIQESFGDHIDYEETLVRMVTSISRYEWYLMEGDKTIGMVCVSDFEDIHYKRLAGATLLWVLPEYRGNIKVKRAVIKALRASAFGFECDYYVRTSKVTPFITKQIVRRT